MKNKNIKYIIFSVLIVILDQVSKYIVSENFDKTACITVIPKLFDFVFVENTGAAFSIFSGKTGILGIVSVVFCITLLGYWIVSKPSSKMLNISFALLFSGALGNAIDRLFRGSVVDFIETAFIDFPVFNVADIAITFGAILAVIYYLFLDKDGQRNGKNNIDGI